MRDSAQLSQSNASVPPHGGLVEWTISKEEWDSFVARSSSRTVQIGFWVALAILVALGFGLPLFLIYAGMPLGLGLVLLGVCGSLALLFAAIFHVAMRGTRLWIARAPGIWDARGCVCPECFAPLTRYADDRDSCGHGHVLEDQPDIVRYLETLATASFGDLGRGAGSDAIAELRKRAAKRGGRRKGGTFDFISSFQNACEQWFGFDQPLWRRAVGHGVVIGLPAAIVLPFSLVGASAFVWVIGFTLVGARALAKSKHRDKRGERGALRYRLLATACGFFALVFPTTVAPMIKRNLPTETLFLIGDTIPDAKPDTFSVLASRPLNAREQQRLADAMLPYIAEWARGGWTSRSNAAWHVGACIATGALPPEYLERLAGALVFIDLGVDGLALGADTGVVEVGVGQQPVFTLSMGGEPRFLNSMLGRVALVYTSADLDGVPIWIASTATTNQAQRFTVTDTKAAGTRTLTVHAWIAVVPTGTTIDSIDAAGAPVLPPSSRGAWKVERKITLRIR